MPKTISACLIVTDEEERLPAALASVAFCDQIVVVDGGSVDRTLEIARAAGAVVVENPWPGYSAQRNLALDHATSDWILEIDADEQVTPELREEICRFLDGPPPGYEMCALPQVHRFLGGELRASMKYPAYRMRMFLSGAYRHAEARSVHEGLWPKGPVWPFEHDLTHELAASWAEALRDASNYARLEASLLAPTDSRLAPAKGMLLRPAGKFWYRLLIDEGWRDGWRGVARIALDCATDALMWVRRGRSGRLPGPRAPAEGHFGARRPAGWGTPVVIGVASGAVAASTAERWLADAARLGIDVALLTDSPPEGSAVRVRPLRRFGPLALIRGLGAEGQLRGQPDAMLVEGRLARYLVRLMPAGVRGRLAGVDASEDPRALRAKLESR